MSIVAVHGPNTWGDEEEEPEEPEGFMAPQGLMAGGEEGEGDEGADEEEIEDEEPPEISDEDIFDPADYTVAEVIEYAEANPDQVDDLIAAEQAGKNRSTLIAQLEAMQAGD